MKNDSFGAVCSGQQGAMAVIVAILLPVLLGFAAFAVDIPNLYVARNELQNAADAGALAAARFLYRDNGKTVNTGADAIASEAAMANFSQKTAVEVESVERGHWSFGLAGLPKGFTFNPSTEPVNLNVSTAELDGNPDFINAVRVVTQRSDTPVASFFARLFGKESFALSAEAVAYIGFAGTLGPLEYDQPIGICLQSITEDGAYSCNIGRMLNSGSNTATSNTAGWTNFLQPCSTANASEMRSILSMACTGDGANVNPVNFGEPIGSTGGVQDNIFRDLEDCWRTASNEDGGLVDSDGDGIPDQPWMLVLPVIDCPGNNVGNCSEVRGAVTIQIIWIQEKVPNKIEEATCAEIPCRMGAWSSDEPDGQLRWNKFAADFQLLNADGQPAPIAKKSIYFLPDCEPHEPTGTTGGDNYGILAEIPVLVQ